MKIKKVERIYSEKDCGGEGYAIIEKFLQQESFNKKIKLFAKVKLQSNDSIGYHKHTVDQEYYYILKGNGIYNDNGNIFEVKSGDLLFCEENRSHSIKNENNEDLEFLAIIVY